MKKSTLLRMFMRVHRGKSSRRSIYGLKPSTNFVRAFQKAHRLDVYVPRFLRKCFKKLKPSTKFVREFQKANRVGVYVPPYMRKYFK